MFLVLGLHEKGEGKKSKKASQGESASKRHKKSRYARGAMWLLRLKRKASDLTSNTIK